MKIPKSLKFNGRVLKVFNTKVPPVESLKDTTTRGYASTLDPSLVWVSNELEEDAQASVFMHELLELITLDNEIDLSHSNLCVISNQLFSIMRENNIYFSEEKKVGKCKPKPKPK